MLLPIRLYIKYKFLDLTQLIFRSNSMDLEWIFFAVLKIWFSTHTPSQICRGGTPKRLGRLYIYGFDRTVVGYFDVLT